MSDIIGVPTILLPRDPAHEFVRIMTHAEVDKRDERYDEYVAMLRARGLHGHELFAKAERDIKPYERVVGDYNALVDNGIELTLNLLCGEGGTNFATANARLGVGDSTVVWGTTQTDLQAATNKLRKAMQSGTYPQHGTKLETFKSDFTSGEANWVWNEWAIFNAASGATSMLSRKVENLGTKASGTWTLTITLAYA